MLDVLAEQAVIEILKQQQHYVPAAAQALLALEQGGGLITQGKSGGVSLRPPQSQPRPPPQPPDLDPLEGADDLDAMISAALGDESRESMIDFAQIYHCPKSSRRSSSDGDVGAPADAGAKALAQQQYQAATALAQQQYQQQALAQQPLQNSSRHWHSRISIGLAGGTGTAAVPGGSVRHGRKQAVGRVNIAALHANDQSNQNLVVPRNVNHAHQMKYINHLKRNLLEKRIRKEKLIKNPRKKLLKNHLNIPKENLLKEII